MRQTLRIPFGVVFELSTFLGLRLGQLRKGRWIRHRL